MPMTLGSALLPADVRSDGTLVIIEVQADRQDDYLHRILYGVSKCVVDNLPQGVLYDQIKKVISVSVVYFNLGSGNDYGTTSFRGLHINGDHLTPNTLNPWLPKQ